MVNTSESKKVLFRLKGDMKKNFSIALLDNEVGAQHILEAFVERVIAYADGDGLTGNDKRTVRSLFVRARELQAEAKT
jgi:hypothetical protein